MQIDVEGKFDSEDLKELVRLSLRPLRRVYLPVFVIVPILAGAMMWQLNQPIESIVLLLLPAQALLVAFVFWMVRQQQQKLTSNRNIIDAVMRICITDKAYSVLFQSETQTALTELNWDRIKSFAENKRACCSFQINRSLLYLPKHWLTED